jgi:hypothetical protein
MAATRLKDINEFLQDELSRRGLPEASAVEAASWLEEAGLLSDSETRPGKPLRDLLRDGAIDASEQRPPRKNGRWFIVRHKARTGEVRMPRLILAAAPQIRSVARSGRSRSATGVAAEAFLDRAMMALAGPGRPLEDARSSVPSGPGLYAMHGDARTWADLGLGTPPDARPLYVGKAEASLIARDLNTHFGSGRTGSSTVRRSVAALLRDTLGLAGVPRNPNKPERPANFGLLDVDDAKLGQWMASGLSLATWSKPATCESLLAVERLLLARWSPPLNLQDNESPWKTDVLAARKRMADDARRWARARGLEI